MTLDEMADMLYVIRLALNEQQQQINAIEIALDNLRVEFKYHDHPYKPEPRYGG